MVSQDRWGRVGAVMVVGVGIQEVAGVVVGVVGGQDVVGEVVHGFIATKLQQKSMFVKVG